MGRIMERREWGEREGGQGEGVGSREGERGGRRE